MEWSVAHADDWARAIASRDRVAARALYDDLARVLGDEASDDGRVPVLSSPHVNDAIRRRLASLPGRRGLDVGCGPTPVAALALAAAGLQATGVDVSPALLSMARRTGAGRVELAAADGEALPFRDRAFDVVTCDDTIEHVFDQDAMVAELARVLRPGGRLLLVTPNASAVHVLAARARDLLHGRRLPRERYHVTESHVRELRWRELRGLLRPWFTVRGVERVPYEGGRRWRAVNRLLRLPGAWRLGPVWFLELERASHGPTAAVDAAAHYATRTDPESQTSPDVVREAVDRALAGVSPAGPALDVGCGSGANLAALRRAGLDPVGVDVAPAAAARASAVAPVAVADAAALPFGDATVGTAVCTEVLEHVGDAGAVLREVARVLRPGGTAVVSTPNYANLAGIHKRLADRRSGRHDWNPWGAHEGGYEAFMTARRLRSIAAPHFDVLAVEALDYGQALTGRFRALDLLASSRAGGAVLRRLLPRLERPGLPLLPWHGMHVVMVLRRRPGGHR